MAEELPKTESMEKLKKKIAEPIQSAQAKQGKGEIIFDNDGNMVVNNREYRRGFKKLWRAVQEGKKTSRYYTRKHPSRKAIKNKRKAERQNKKKGKK